MLNMIHYLLYFHCLVGFIADHDYDMSVNFANITTTSTAVTRHEGILDFSQLLKVIFIIYITALIVSVKY